MNLICFQIAEMGAYVKLLEYDNIGGMILLSELSRRRIRSIQKLIRVGRNEVVVVLRVDKEKGTDISIHYRNCTDKAGLQVISIFRSVGSHQRISSSARRDTIRARWYTRLCAMLRRKHSTLLRTSMNASPGR